MHPISPSVPHRGPRARRSACRSTSHPPTPTARRPPRSTPAGLPRRPPAGYSGAIQLDVTATASDNGTSASVDHTLAVTVAGVATPPNLTVSAVAGNEDTAIPLTITASLNDTDGSETLSITVTGLPTGAALNHGTQNA